MKASIKISDDFRKNRSSDVNHFLCSRHCLRAAVSMDGWKQCCHVKLQLVGLSIMHSNGLNICGMKFKTLNTAFKTHVMDSLQMISWFLNRWMPFMWCICILQRYGKNILLCNDMRALFSLPTSSSPTPISLACPPKAPPACSVRQKYCGK